MFQLRLLAVTRIFNLPPLFYIFRVLQYINHFPLIGAKNSQKLTGPTINGKLSAGI